MVNRDNDGEGNSKYFLHANDVLAKFSCHSRKRVFQISKVDDEGRWNVGYLATVKLTLLTTGALHEDVGSGEAINESKLKAHEMALKAAVTDAMKRAARHFGERLGNALYRSGASLANAPRDNKTALHRVDWNHGLDFGNQAELHDQKKRGLPFPPKPGSKEAVIDTTMKQSNKALKPERNTMNQQLQLKSNQHQQPIQQASNEPLARISIEPSSDVLQITPMASRQQPAIVHPGSSSYGFVRASAVQEIFSVTPQAPQDPQLVTKQPPLPRYAPLDRTSPSEMKRKGSDELESPRVAKRLHVTLCNPYR